MVQEQMYSWYFQHSGRAVQYVQCPYLCVHVVLKIDGGCQVVMGICGILSPDDM